MKCNAARRILLLRLVVVHVWLQADAQGPPHKCGWQELRGVQTQSLLDFEIARGGAGHAALPILCFCSVTESDHACVKTKRLLEKREVHIAFLARKKVLHSPSTRRVELVCSPFAVVSGNVGLCGFWT